MTQMHQCDGSLSRRNAIVRAVHSAPLRKRVAFRVGEALAAWMQKRSEAVESGNRVGSMRLVDRVIRNGIRARAIRQADHLRLRNMHRAFWSAEAREFGETYACRFRNQFLDQDAEILSVAESLDPRNIDNVYEIGCGNGQVLNYLADCFPSAKQLVGLDIDNALIQRNRDHFSSGRMKFVQADALEWLSSHAENRSLVVTNGGVLEYFLEKELAEFFLTASRPKPIAVALIETIGSDHDLERDTSTHVYGPELSFSHNYPWLLRESGFEIRHQSERIDPSGNRWLRVVATTGHNDDSKS